MKKIFVLIALVIVMCLCILLISGNNRYFGDNTLSNNKNTDYSRMDKYVFTVDSYYDYLNFIHSSELPDDFVYYDDICVLGDFVDFICMSDARIGDFSHYLYTIKDEEKFEITLYIEDADSRETIEMEPISIADPQNMRTVVSTLPVMYEYEGIRYTYVEGKLNSVKWQNDEWAYSVYVDDPCLGEYPNNSSTIVGKLLNLDTALDTIVTIHEMSAHKVKTTNLIRAIILCIVLVIGIAIVLASVVRKKKRISISKTNDR